MTRRPLRDALLALAAAGAVSCSLMVDYDLEGKPCNKAGDCRLGYVCTRSHGCQPGVPDGGASDAGPGDAGAADAGAADAGAADADLVDAGEADADLADAEVDPPDA